MQTEQYTRKSFPVDAVRVTEENMAEIAAWCEGEIQQTPPAPGVVDYIKVNVHHPLSDRQTRAFVGDWVLFAHKGFKVYTDVAFERNFELVNQTIDLSKEVTDENLDPDDAALTVVQVEPKVPPLVDATVDEVEKAKDVTKAEEPKECGVCGTTWFGGDEICPNSSSHPRSNS